MTELSGGALAGIVIGTLIAVSFIGAFIYCILLPICCKNKKRSHHRRAEPIGGNSRAFPSSRNDDNLYVYSVSGNYPSGNNGHTPVLPPTGGSFTDPGFSVPISPDPGFSVPISPDPGFSVPVDSGGGWSSGGFDSGYSVDTGGGSYDSGGGSYDSGGGSYDSGGGTSSYD